MSLCRPLSAPVLPPFLPVSTASSERNRGTRDCVLHTESVHNHMNAFGGSPRHILTQTGCSSRHGTHFRAFPASLKSCTTYIVYCISCFKQRFPLFVNMIKLGDSSVGSHSANCCIYNFEFSELLNLNVTCM